MGIAGMVIWALTAGIGIYLLAVGIGAQRAAGLARARAAAAASQADSAGNSAAAGADSTAVGTQALAVVMGSKPAPVSPPEGSPLLEFTHPALALLGLTFWIFFVMTGDRLFAWIAFGVVVATVAAGLGWELSRRRRAGGRGGGWAAAAGRRGEGGDGGGPDAAADGRDAAADGPRFPPHLVLAHGAAAACTFALVVIAAVAAGHG